MTDILVVATSGKNMTSLYDSVSCHYNPVVKKLYLYLEIASGPVLCINARMTLLTQ